MLFDTHAHYYDPEFNNDIEDTIARARNNGVEYIITASCDVASCVENVTLTQKYDIFYAAVGIHPHDAGDQSDDVIMAIEEFASYPKVVAIGEIGLDYFYDNSPRDRQKEWFAKQISLARKLKLPVIVHDRDAHEDTLSILKSENAKDAGGVLHCFSGSVEMARQVLDLGFMISVAGPVTFKNAKKLPEVVKFIPDDMLLIETDSPYLTPEPYRGTRNESAYVRLVAEKIAEIKDRPIEYIEQTTTANAMRLFRIQK